MRPDLAVRKESIGEANRAEFERPGEHDVGAFADHELGAAAADVDHEDPFVEERHELDHTEVDQAASSTPDTMSTSIPTSSRARRKNSSRLSATAQCAGCNGVDRGSIAVRNSTEPAECADPALHRLGREHAHHPCAGAEADDLLLTVEHIEMAIRLDPGHDEMERVGAEVDRRRGSRRPARSDATRSRIRRRSTMPGFCPTTGVRRPAHSVRHEVAGDSRRGRQAARCPVSVSRKSSRAIASNSTALKHVTVAARGTFRSRAISPNDWPRDIVRTT